MKEPIDACARCSKPILAGTATVLPDGRPVHVRCLAREAVARSMELEARARDVVDRSERVKARAQHALAVSGRRLPCAICRDSLATAEAVLFQGSRLVHARCWPGDDAPTRLCATCAIPLDAYEPAAFEGRTVYHVRCWAASKENGGSATSG